MNGEFGIEHVVLPVEVVVVESMSVSRGSFGEQLALMLRMSLAQEECEL
jgi:hypothetical protein